MSEEIARTPDDAMIKSWIASLELLWLATDAAVSYGQYLDTADGLSYGDDYEPTADELYMQAVRDAQKALKALCHE